MRKTGRLAILTVFVSLLAVLAPAREPEPALTLTRESKLEVLLSAKPSPAEKYAASELSVYLGKILSIEIPIVESDSAPEGIVPIVLGRHPLNRDLKPESLEIEEAVVDVQSQSIHIAGGREGSPDSPTQHDRGTLYGVYDLLNELGVRWYRPEAWGEAVPSMATLTLPLGKRDSNPVYRYRYGTGTYQTFYPRADTMTPSERKRDESEREMVRRWAVRNRLNTNLSQVSPGDLAQFGGSFRINFSHAYRYLLPHGRYFKTHPEYFALIHGNRSSDPMAQLCLSNPEVQEIVYQSLAAAMRKSPEQKIFSIGPNDGHLWCECDACRAMDDPGQIAAHTGKVSLSNRVVKFNNLVAKRLAKEFPDRKIGWYAYSGETEPPSQVARLEPNTAVMICAFAGSFSDYSRTLYDPSSAQNKRYAEVLRGWKELTAKSGSEMLAYDYWSFYLWPGPLPVIPTMTDRLRHYHKDFGIVGQYMETHPCWGPQGMDYYFYTWLLRNPGADVQAEKEKYYRDYYGPAAEPMRAYHEALDAASRNGPYFGSGGYRIEALFTPARIAAMGTQIGKATRLAEGREPYARRVAGTAAGYEYARRVQEFRALSREGKMDLARKALDDLAAYFNGFGDGSVFDNRRSNRGNWDAVFSNYRKTLDNAAAMFALFENPKVIQHQDNAWKFEIDPEDKGIANGWQGDVSDHGWKRADAGKTWQEQGFPEYHGVAWYRKSFEPPPVKTGRRTILFFEAVDGDATVWLNGIKLGEHLLGEKQEKYGEPFYFDITDALQPGQPNEFAIRVRKEKQVGGLTKPISILQVDAIRAPQE